jgi:hypothetical protein
VNVVSANVICDARAYWCHCALEPGHAGPHECGEERCRGSWIGAPDSGVFEVVRWPLAELERVERRARRVQPTRILCAHADADGRGAHWLEAGEVCEIARAVRL